MGLLVYASQMKLLATHWGDVTSNHEQMQASTGKGYHHSPPSVIGKNAGGMTSNPTGPTISAPVDSTSEWIIHCGTNPGG